MTDTTSVLTLKPDVLSKITMVLAIPSHPNAKLENCISQFRSSKRSRVINLNMEDIYSVRINGGGDDVTGCIVKAQCVSFHI